MSGVATADLNGIFAALRGVQPDSTQSRTFYEDAVTQANTAASAREDRLGSVAGGIPSVIVILVLFNTLVIVGYAVFVGSPSFLPCSRTNGHRRGGRRIDCRPLRPQLPVLGQRDGQYA